MKKQTGICSWSRVFSFHPQPRRNKEIQPLWHPKHSQKRTRDTPPTRKIKNRTKKILKHIENFRPRDGKSKENGQVQERRSKSCPVRNPADQPHPEITGIKNRKPKKADREGFKTKGAPAIQLPVPQQCSSVKNMVKWR